MKKFRRVIVASLALITMIATSIMPYMARAEEEDVDAWKSELMGALKSNTGDERQVSEEPSSQSLSADMSNEARMRSGGIVQLNVLDRVDYNGWFTNYFEADGRRAFCLQPNVDTPAGGSYKINRYMDNNSRFAKGMYYLSGGPGYQTWLDNFGAIGSNPPIESNEYCMSHVMLSYIYDPNGSAFAGLDQGLVDALIYQVGLLDSLPPAPEGFQAFIFNEGGAGQIMGGSFYQPMGRLRIEKTSTNTDITKDNECYSLEGAIYDVLNTDNEKVGEFITDINGASNELTLKTGDYFIMESKAPMGFVKDDTKYQVSITENNLTTQKVGEIPQNNPIDMWLQKIDTGLAANTPQGDALLSNAEFTVKFYGGLYDTDPAVNGIKPLRSWIVKTDEQGHAKIAKEYKVSGDPFYLSAGGIATVPLGTVTITETKAPLGYLLPAHSTKVVKITSNSKAESVTTYQAPTQEEAVVRGGLRVAKWDKEINTGKAQGAATLAGTKLEIVNMSKRVVIVEGKPYKPGEVVKTIITNITGIAETAADLLPFGTYEVREAAPPQGYLSKGDLKRSFKISENGKIVDLTGDDTAIKNLPIRGDLEFLKIEDGSQKRMANIPFRITSKTTGESHVVMTDKNGYYSTKSSWNKHSDNTNKGKSSSDGVWFGSKKTVNDKVGALLYDTYILDELPCDNNKGKILIQNVEVTIERNNTTVKLGTITNDAEPKISIHTTATNKAMNGKVAFPTNDVVITDRVSYENLVPGLEYEVKGFLMDKEANETLKVDGKEITAEIKFTPNEDSGSVELEFPLDATKLAGKDVVVFEELSQGDRIEAGHKDINDKGQTIHVVSPKIGTKAREKDTDKQEIAVSNKVTIVDTVSYDDLIAGKEYTVKGTLMDKSSNAPLLIEDKEVIAEKTFKAKDTKGEVSLEFTFDASMLAGKEVVAFEKVFYDGREIGVHEDINDKDQTVKFVQPPREETPPNEPSKPNKPNTPSRKSIETGDHAPLLVFGSALLSSAGIATYIFIKRRKIS